MKSTHRREYSRPLPLHEQDEKEKVLALFDGDQRLTLDEVTARVDGLYHSVPNVLRRLVESGELRRTAVLREVHIIRTYWFKVYRKAVKEEKERDRSSVTGKISDRVVISQRVGTE